MERLPASAQAHGYALNKPSLAVLEKRQGKHPKYVFTYEGHPVKQVSTHAWYAALKRAGIEDFRFHDLRHTFSSWFVQDGGSLLELTHLVGWKTPAMANRYAHLAQSGLQKAAARIDNVLGYATATPETQRGRP